MTSHLKARLVVSALLAAMTLPAVAADQDRTQDQLRTQDQIRDQDIYGSQLMTAQERNEYRTRMRATNTLEERERVRAEHHEQMRSRAKERGVSLPDSPPPAGMGGAMGPGGMGPGGGMGGGGRR